MGERNTFRYFVGGLALIGGMVGLLALYWVEIPTGNRDAVTLALGIVLGWGSSVISGEWGSSPAGREAARIGVGQPLKTEVVNTENAPVPTRDADK